MCEECPKYRPAPSYPHIDPGCRGNLAPDNLLSEPSIAAGNSNRAHIALPRFQYLPFLHPC